MELIINNLVYNVELVDKVNQSDDLGLFNCETQTITIKSSLSDGQKIRTFLHELAHAYMWCYGFSDVEFNEETICNFIGVYFELMQKDLKKFLIEFIENKKGVINISYELNNEGKDLLERDFENKVIDLYGDFFNKETWDYEENIVEDIRNRDKLKFIKDIYYAGTKQKDFILNNWDKLDVIINILFLHYIATEEPTEGDNSNDE